MAIFMCNCRGERAPAQEGRVGEGEGGRARGRRERESERARERERERETLLVADELDVLLQGSLVPFNAALTAQQHVQLRWAENLLTAH